MKHIKLASKQAPVKGSIFDPIKDLVMALVEEVGAIFGKG
jgi:hypothetical protein